MFFHLPLLSFLEMGKPKCFDIKIQNRRFQKIVSLGSLKQLAALFSLYCFAVKASRVQTDDGLRLTAAQRITTFPQKNYHLGLS